MKNVTIVAQEFKWPLNCGALARAAANFGFKIAFISPKCEHDGEEAIKFSKHAKDLLRKAVVFRDLRELLKKFDYVIATTSMLGTDYNIPRSPLDPEQLASKLAKVDKKVAIVIGREGEGMSNEEVKMCDFVVTIPTSKKYPTMNVSHAASIIMYELSKRSPEKKIGENIPLAGEKEKAALLTLIDENLKKLDFEKEEKRETQRIIWKRILGKSFLTKREANALFGFFKKLK